MQKFLVVSQENKKQQYKKGKPNLVKLFENVYEQTFCL